MVRKSSEHREPNTKAGLLSELESARKKIAELEAEMAHLREGAPSAAPPSAAASSRSPVEPYFRGLIEGSLQAIFVRQDHTAVFANQAYADMFGYDSPEELIGSDHQDLVTPEDSEWMEKYRAARLKGEDVPARYQYRGIHKDGSTIWIDGMRQLITWQGKPAVLVTLSDITEHKQAEEKLRESEGRLRRAEMIARMGHYAFDLDRGNSVWSDGFKDMWGIAEGSDPQFEDAVQRLHPEDSEWVMEAFGRAVEALQGFDLEHRILRPDGKVVWMRSVGEISTDPGSEPPRFFGTLVDITEYKQAQENLRAGRRLLQTIFDALPISVLVKDASLRFLMVNRVAAERHGQVPSDFPGHTTGEMIPLTEEALRENRDNDQWVLEHGEMMEIPEHLQRYKDKEDRWHRVIKAPLVDEDGRVSGLVTVREDITEQRQAAQKLEESRTLLQTIFDTIPVGLFVKDAEGRYLMTNRSFCEPLNVEPADIQGKLPDEVWDQDEEESARRRSEDRYVMESDRQLEIPAVPVTFGEITNWYQAVKSPLHDHAGNVVGIVASRMDITERLRMESQLRNMEKMEAVGKLAGGMAHEFNNILHMILGFTELMLDITPPEDSRHGNLNTIKTASEKGAALVRQLLGYSRKQILQPKLMDLNDLLASTTQILMTTLGSQIVFQLKPGQNLPRVFVDSNSIEQILLNLCLNARDAMPGGGNLTIALRGVYLDEVYCADREWAKPGGYVHLSVADSGTGIPEEVLPYIFDPFFSTKGPQDGSGLGLSMVHGLMEQQRGCINVITEPGEGTIIDLYFPVPESEGAHNLPLANREPEQAADPPPVVAPTVRGTILVVEDEAGVQQLSRQVLAARGYRVLHAFDGEEGLRLFEQHAGNIDLVLLDVIMPGMDGKELYEKITAFKADVPVVFHSGYHLSARYTQYISDKGVKLLRKPYSSAELIQAVEEALGDSNGK